ncbi:helix-turn-helix domain-containing protein [Nocardiopsis sinuspersici]|uniref:helix-turn-helix domain-containing protein n=1 Tax=Nocardiopsis sinuspersici TaxID=501010 RepID=UPI0015CBA25B
MRTAYECRARPDPEQRTRSGPTFGCVRPAWRETLARRRTAHHRRGERTPYKQTCAAPTGWRRSEDPAFSSEVPSVPLRRALRHRHSAFADLSAGRARHPRFGPRAGKRSERRTRGASRIRRGGSLRPRTRPRSRRPGPSATPNPVASIVSREPGGRRHAAFAVEAEDPAPARTGTSTRPGTSLRQDVPWPGRRSRVMPVEPVSDGKGPPFRGRRRSGKPLSRGGPRERNRPEGTVGFPRLQTGEEVKSLLPRLRQNGKNGGIRFLSEAGNAPRFRLSTGLCPTPSTARR